MSGGVEAAGSPRRGFHENFSSNTLLKNVSFHESDRGDFLQIGGSYSRPGEMEAVQDDVKELRVEIKKLYERVDAKEGEIQILVNAVQKHSTVIAEMSKHLSKPRSSDKNEENNVLSDVFGSSSNRQIDESAVKEQATAGEPEGSIGRNFQIIVRQLQQKSDMLVSRLQFLESSSNNVSKDVKERVRRTEFQSAMNDIDTINKEIKRKIVLLAGHEQLMSVKDNLTSLEGRVECMVSKHDLNLVRGEMQNKVEGLIESSYMKKQSYKVETTERNRRIDEFTEKVQKRLDEINLKEAKMQEIIAKFGRALDFKVDIKDLQELREMKDNFLQKKHLDEVYSRILPKFTHFEKIMYEQEFKLTAFRRFVEITDEALLFKATKMDYELMAKELLEQKAQMKIIDDSQRDFSQRLPEVEATCVESAERAVLAFIKEQIGSVIEEAKLKIQIEADRHLDRDQIGLISVQIENLNTVLKRKADISDLIVMSDQKTHKQSTEKLAEFVNILHKGMKHVSFYCLQFMKTFTVAAAETDLVNQRFVIISKSIAQLESLFQQMSARSLTSFVSQPANEKHLLKSNVITSQQRFSSVDSSMLFDHPREASKTAHIQLTQSNPPLPFISDCNTKYPISDQKQLSAQKLRRFAQARPMSMLKYPILSGKESPKNVNTTSHIIIQRHTETTPRNPNRHKSTEIQQQSAIRSSGKSLSHC